MACDDVEEEDDVLGVADGARDAGRRGATNVDSCQESAIEQEDMFLRRQSRSQVDDYESAGWG